MSDLNIDIVIENINRSNWVSKLLFKCRGFCLFLNVEDSSTQKIGEFHKFKNMQHCLGWKLFKLFFSRGVGQENCFKKNAAIINIVFFHCPTTRMDGNLCLPTQWYKPPKLKNISVHTSFLLLGKQINIHV